MNKFETTKYTITQDLNSNHQLQIYTEKQRNRALWKHTKQSIKFISNLNDFQVHKHTGSTILKKNKFL